MFSKEKDSSDGSSRVAALVVNRRLMKELDGLQNLYSQVAWTPTCEQSTNPTQDLHMRLVISIHALEHAMQSFAAIEALVIKETKFDPNFLGIDLKQNV